MTIYRLENNVNTTLVDPIDSSTTVIRINTAVEPYNDPIVPDTDEVGTITLIDDVSNPSKIEIVYFTGFTNNGDGTLTLTGVNRGQENTTQYSFSSGAVATQSLTRDAINSLRSTTGFTGIFITNVIPANPGKNVSITYNDLPNQDSVSQILTDDTEVIITLEWDRGLEYQGIPTVNGTEILTYTEKTAGVYINDGITVDISGVDEILCTHNGVEYSVEILYDNPPVIQTANFVNGYPGSQTELKEGDSFDFNITSDINFDRIEIYNYGAYVSQTFDVTEGVESTVTAYIADRGNTTQNLGARVRIRKPSGVWSESHLTENDASVDGTNLVKLNNQYPVISISSVDYPAGQEAIKNTESATVNNTVTYYDDIIYSSPNSQLTVENTNTFESNKVVSRLSGDYNISSNNFRIVANRNANDATSSSQNVVNIAHSAATINISFPARLRSGGNDGTEAQNHTITISSDQNKLSSAEIELSAPVGIWQGSWSGSTTSFTRSLQIHDDMVKGGYDFTGLSFTNLAGVETTVINSGTTYTIGGFVSREITLEAFANEALMNVAATIYNKVTLSWSFEPSVDNREPLDSSPPITDGWCLVALETNPTTIRILDTKTDASSQASTITIQEAI